MFEVRFDIEEAVRRLELTHDEFFEKRFLEDVGNACLHFIIKEAKADLTKQGGQKGKPEGIPNDPKFFESFGFEITNEGSIEIYSTWPWIDQIIEGRKPYPMKWLTQPKVKKVPFSKKTPLIRSAPGSREAWIHPGFKSHNFIQRGVEQALSRLNKNFANQVRRSYAKKARKA